MNNIKVNDDLVRYGSKNVIRTINPYQCYFVAYYRDGSAIKGNNLFDTGWKELPDGIMQLSYVLSTGKIINIPNQFDAYMHLVEVSQSLFGDRLFHSVTIKGITNTGDIIDYKIILKQDKFRKHNIGDVLVDKCANNFKSPYWKLASR